MKYQNTVVFGLSALSCAIVLATVTASHAPLAAAAEGVPRIGFLAFGPSGCHNAAFHKGMQELGYVDGKNMIFDCRHAGGGHDGLDAAAAEIVRAKPEVIVAIGHAPAQSSQRATRTIPVVVSVSGEPVESGLVQNLSRPGGNITGVSYFNTELNIKRLELLKTAVPNLKRLAVLTFANTPADMVAAYERDCKEGGRVLGFEIKVFSFRKLEELDRAFDEIVAFGADGVFVVPMRPVAAETKRIVDLSRRHRLPVMHFHKSFAKGGGLMNYGVDYAILHHRMAAYVDKILKGAKPAELPIEQPARYEFAVNLKTAGALGLTIRPELLLRADEVIR